MAIQSPLKDRSLLQKIFLKSLKSTFQKYFFLFYRQPVTKIVRLAPPPSSSMLVASFLAHCWPRLHVIVFSYLTQHLVKREGKFWVSLSKSNIFWRSFYENIASIRKIIYSRKNEKKFKYLHSSEQLHIKSVLVYIKSNNCAYDKFISLIIPHFIRQKSDKIWKFCNRKLERSKFFDSGSWNVLKLSRWY